MAANYWASHSSACLVSRQHLLSAHREDRARGLTESHIQQIKIFFINQIWELARTCRLRYRVAATACVYFRRFYTRNSFGGSCADPRLVHVGCLYLASKTEETLLAAKHLVVYVRRVQPAWPYDMKHLLDSEMVIIQELDFHLVVYHPYRPLLQYVADAHAPTHITQAAWAALNDLHHSDLPLMHPPHILALGCLLYACAAANSKLATDSKQPPQADAGPPGSQRAAQGSAAAHPSPSTAQTGARKADATSTAAGSAAQKAAGKDASGLGASQPTQAGAAGQPGKRATSEAKEWQCMEWLLQLHVDLALVFEVVEQLDAMYRAAGPPLTTEECKRLLDIASLPLPPGPAQPQPG